jgi:hypothetical protein
MARHILFRALVPVSALALTGAIGLSPASAGAATWQIATVVGDPGLQTQFSSVAASSPGNAWAAGVTCSDIFCSSLTAIAEQWNGQGWQPVTLPDTNVGASGFGVVVATSSASNTWVFGADANNIGYGVHITGSGTTETALPASGGITFNGAAVFSPADAWAFGITGDFFLDNFSAYAAHYDGQTWTQMPTPPVVPDSVSALSSDNLWILGQTSVQPGSSLTFAAARWTGSGWDTVPIPDAAGLKLPAGTLFNPISILANSPSDVWVTADLDTTCPPCGVGSGVLLLHWNANSWHSVEVPAALNIGAFDQDIAPDGQGGLWISGFETAAQNFAGPFLYHFLNEHWTSQPVPTQNGLFPQFGALAEIPGTTSLWGAATLFNFTTGTSQGAIYQTGP